MSNLLVRRQVRRAELGLTAREFGVLAHLSTPPAIQAFLNAIPINHELTGETVHSVRGVLRHRKAHCIEAALLAACALWIHGDPPLVMHLDCDPCDYPHIVTLFRRGRTWGAISKSNGAYLRYRDPVYRTLRELAMSYVHEYFDKRGHKTLRSYSGAFDLRRIDPSLWVSNENACWVAHDRLAALRHYPLVSARQARSLAPRDAFERQSARLVEYPRPGRTRRTAGR